ncbi:MAG: hypothetical protein GX776_06010 [Oxalobacter sp.]|nr:hypothetical protein [Oxalobacter sp.]
MKTITITLPLETLEAIINDAKGMVELYSDKREKSKRMQGDTDCWVQYYTNRMIESASLYSTLKKAKERAS